MLKVLGSHNRKANVFVAVEFIYLTGWLVGRLFDWLVGWSVVSCTWHEVSLSTRKQSPVQIKVRHSNHFLV